VRFVLLRYEDESALNCPPSIPTLLADEKKEPAEVEGAIGCIPEYARELLPEAPPSEDEVGLPRLTYSPWDDGPGVSAGGGTSAAGAAS
jgi:hypothetical protein